MASASSAISLTTSAAAPATGRSRPSSRKPRNASGNRSARQGRLRAVGRRRFHRRGDAHSPGNRRPTTCIFVDNGLLRYDEANQIVKRFSEKLQLPLDFVDAIEPLPRSPLRRRRSRAEAEDHRRHLHRCVRTAREGAGRLRFPGAGHALPGCHRVGIGAWPCRRDQEPPQCRRSAGADEVSRSSNRSATCSRTKCGASDRIWGWTASSSCDSHFQARALLCG